MLSLNFSVVTINLIFLFLHTGTFHRFKGSGYEGSYSTTSYEGSYSTTGYEGSDSTTGYEGSYSTTGCKYRSGTREAEDATG